MGRRAVNNLDPAQAPIVLPTHFTLAGDELLMHLARPNPVWPHLDAAEVRLAVDAAPHGRMLSGIRGVRLTVLRVGAKFKYGDHHPVEHRERAIGHLEQRSHGLDAGAATQQGRRLAAIGDWQTRRDRP